MSDLRERVAKLRHQLVYTEDCSHGELCRTSACTSGAPLGRDEDEWCRNCRRREERRETLDAVLDILDDPEPPKYDDTVREVALAMMQYRSGPGQPDEDLARVAIGTFLRHADREALGKWALSESGVDLTKWAKDLATMAIQSDRYARDPMFGEAVDKVLAYTSNVP